MEYVKGNLGTIESIDIQKPTGLIIKSGAGIQDIEEIKKDENFGINLYHAIMNIYKKAKEYGILPIDIYRAIFNLIEKKIDLNPDNISLTSTEFNRLTDGSKKKLIKYKFLCLMKKKYLENKGLDGLSFDDYVKRQEKNIKRLYFIIKYLKYHNYHYSRFFDIVGDNFENGLLMELYLKHFVENEKDVNYVLSGIASDFDTQRSKTTIEILQLFGFENDQIVKFFSQDQVKLGTNIKKGDINTGYIEGTDSLRTINCHTLSQNLILNSFTLDLLINRFGKYGGIQIYKNNIFEIIDSILEQFKLKKYLIGDVSFFFEYKKEEEKEKEKEKKEKKEKEKEEIYHITYEWELDEGFDDNIDLLNIGSLFKQLELTDLFEFSGDYKRLDFFIINDFDGDLEYKGIFCNGKYFNGTNIVVLRDNITNKRRLRISFESELEHDIVIFLVLQIAYYLKNKKFIDYNQLFQEIYFKYNNKIISEKSPFDLKIFEKIYEKFIRKIIFPYSMEYFDEKGDFGKFENTLIVGLPGTGKTQSIFYLMKNNEFYFRGKKFTKNFFIISIGVKEIFDLTQSGDKKSLLYQRLMNIYKRIGIPIVLFIEDIDTLMENMTNHGENNFSDNSFTQALTCLLDGIGDIPFKVIATSNYPEKTPSRLLRPNRFENIIFFDIILPDNIIEELIEFFINKYGLSATLIELFGKDGFKNKYLKLLKFFSPSHIDGFIRKIREYIDFEKKINTDYNIDTHVIHKIYEEIVISLKDTIQRNGIVNQWITEITTKKDDLRKLII